MRNSYWSKFFLRNFFLDLLWTFEHWLFLLLLILLFNFIILNIQSSLFIFFTLSICCTGRITFICCYWCDLFIIWKNFIILILNYLLLLLLLLNINFMRYMWRWSGLDYRVLLFSFAWTLFIIVYNLSKNFLN